MGKIAIVTDSNSGITQDSGTVWTEIWMECPYRYDSDGRYVYLPEILQTGL